VSAATVRVALAALLASYLRTDKDVQVFDGRPPNAPAAPDVIALMADRTETDGEEERVVIDLVVSCYVGGGPEAQSTANVRAHALLADVRAAIYADPTLDDECRAATLDNDHTSDVGTAYDPTGKIPVGRLAAIEATVSAWPARPLLGSLAAADVIP
jgi:hypothetical protein